MAFLMNLNLDAKAKKCDFLCSTDGVSDGDGAGASRAHDRNRDVWEKCGRDCQPSTY